MGDELQQLFQFNSRPLKFTIIKDNMLNVKLNQLIKKIEKNGGVYLEYELRDNETIILAAKFHLTDENEDIFNMRYIKSCISENKILCLKGFQFKSSSDQNSTSECPAFAELLEKCSRKRDFGDDTRTPEKDLEIIHKRYFS